MTSRDKYHYQEARVVVFGASGFIGRWVSRALCQQGAKLYLVVRDGAFAEQVFSGYGLGGEIIELDLEHTNLVERAIEKIAPDVTFNLAGYGVDRSERDEGTAYRINATLVKIICDSLSRKRKSGWPGQELIHVGSALEYGEVEGNLWENSAVNPTTSYGKSKLLGTNFVRQCCQKCRVKGVTARLFTVYGLGEHRGRLLPSLLEAARTGKPLPLTSGSQKRDFTYVENVAEGLLRLGLSEAEPGEVVNLATGRLTSVRSFAETAAEILRIPAEKLSFGAVPTRAEEMQHDEVATDRLLHLTAWTPPTNIAEGIRRTKEFEQAHGEITD